MASKDVDIRVKANTRDATRSLREMERQVDKLHDLADAGGHRQEGFLSAKQVQMYERILREMERTKERHQQKLSQMEDAYDKSQSSKAQKRLKDLEEEVRKRQQLLLKAEGQNKWGDEASPIVQEFHRTKLDQAEQELKTYKGSDELKKSLTDISRLQANINVMKAAVQSIQDEQDRGAVHANRIGQMHQLDPHTRRMVNHVGDAIGATGAIVGAHAYWNYTKNGVDLLRRQEKATNAVALQGGFPVGGQVDGELRRNNYKLGEAQYYDTYDTAVQQKTIISGGTTGNLKALGDDTKAVQRFGRAYSMDPNMLASGGAMLQRMGALKEGEQQHLANLIAGSISKNSMNGRQEEMVRATISLAQSVSQGQAVFTQKQLDNTVGMQVALGKAVPELKGERGANMLATMDSAIKGGGQQLDLLMGKGIEFTGLHGMTQLEQLKEQGLSNPENLQRVLKGAKRMFGGNQDMTKWALKEQLGLQMNEYDALNKSGFLDKIMKDPNSVTSTDLNKIGAKELAKQWNVYKNSETAQVDKADSRGRNLQASHSQFADETAKMGRNSLWHDMPDWLQQTMIPLSALGGVAMGTAGGKLLRRRLTNAVTRGIRPNINGEGGWRTWLNRGGTTAVEGEEGTSGLLSRLSGMKPKMGGFGTRTLETMGKIGTKAPVVGALLGTGLDQVVNPENSWGRSLTKGIGGAIGGALGGAAGVALGFGTMGAGWLGTGALAIGGGMAGEKTGDWLYSLFAGDGDKKKSPGKVPTTDTSSSKVDVKLNAINTDKLSINNKELASYFDKQSSKKNTDGSNSGKSNEQVLRIVLEGDIKGMSKKNEDKVADSVKNYFTTAFSYSNNPFKFNLSLDQNRG